MKNQFFKIFTLAFLLTACGTQNDLPEEPYKSQEISYPGPWLSDGNEFGGIVNALMQNSIRGCGEFYYRVANGDGSTGEALVYCTRDGQSWTHYIVFYRVGKVVPTGAIPGVPLPR